MQMNESSIPTYNVTNMPYTTRQIQAIYSVFIALLPVIMYYKVPFLNFGMATFVLGVFLPYSMIFVLNGIVNNCYCFPVTIYLLYLICRSADNLQNLFLLFVILMHVCAAYCGSMELRTIRKTIETIAVLATIGVIVQTFLHYVMGVDVLLLARDLLTEENQLNYSTGYGSTFGIYRPASFFAEPSHLTSYCSLGLLSILSSSKIADNDIRKAILISVGCILTTSGIGIVLVVCSWGWYELVNKQRERKTIITVIATVLGIGVVILVLLQIPVFHTAVNRIFATGNGDGGIEGRTMFWQRNIGGMEGTDKLFGYGTLKLPDNYMTGMMYMIYCYGYVGTILYYLLLAFFAWKSKDKFTIVQCLVIGGMQVISNNVGFIPMTFRLAIIVTSMRYALKQRYNDTDFYEEGLE